MADNKLQLYIRSGGPQASIEQTLKDRAGDFTTTLLTVINSNPLFQECDYNDVVKTALKAASMRLPIDPNLGLAYMIVYRNKKKEKLVDYNSDGKQIVRWKESYVYEPQLQIGWKGFVQLALRTRLYKTINVTDVHESEHQGEDRLTGAINFQWIDDTLERNKKPVVGYVAYFRLHDGFEKILYMSVAELEAHALKYSQSYKQYGSGVWKDDKPAMSKKTVVKLLISKWGPQSTEIQKALRADQAAMGDDDTYDYIDNQKTKPSSDNNDPVTSDENKSQTIDGEVIDQMPKQPTEAEAPQTPPVKATPKTVKAQAAEWAAKHRNASATSSPQTEA